MSIFSAYTFLFRTLTESPAHLAYLSVFSPTIQWRVWRKTRSRLEGFNKTYFNIDVKQKGHAGVQIDSTKMSEIWRGKNLINPKISSLQYT